MQPNIILYKLDLFRTQEGRVPYSCKITKKDDYCYLYQNSIQTVLNTDR